MIEAQHLTKRYGKTVAVDEASFAVRPGRVAIGHPGVLRAMVFGAVAVSLVAVIGVGIGSLIRHTEGAATSSRRGSSGRAGTPGRRDGNHDPWRGRRCRWRSL